MITVERLSKSYGSRRAVDDLTFTAAPGKVTGFLGPNGAGRSTTMRLILGLDRPNTGHATVNGRPLSAHPRPLAEVAADRQHVIIAVGGDPPLAPGFSHYSGTPVTSANEGPAMGRVTSNVTRNPIERSGSWTSRPLKGRARAALGAAVATDGRS